MVESTIDLEAIDRHVYNIKPDFDEGLRDISESIQEVIEGLDEEHARVAEDLGFATDGKILHFEQSGVHGYVFRLTRKVGASSIAFILCD